MSSETGVVRAPGSGVETRSLVRRGGGLRRLVTSLISRRLERMILPIVGGPVFFAIVRAAFQLDLVGLLLRHPGLRVEEIRQRLELQEEPARILLLGCVALRILRKRGDRYYCGSFVARRLFRRDGAWSLEPVLEWMQQIVAPSMRYFEESMREATAAGLRAFSGEEDNLYGRIAHDPELQTVFYNAMNARTRTVNEGFLDRINFEKFRVVLDVGGGDGEILLAIVRRYPQVQGVLLEIPPVADRANERFQGEGLADRLTAIGGDMFRDEFPSGHDCALFCHVNGNHSPESNRDLLRRAYASLPSGGHVMVYSAFMDDDGSGPLSSAMLSAYFYCTVSGQGRQYSWAESEAWVSGAGFVDLTRAVIAYNHGVILARKP